MNQPVLQHLIIFGGQGSGKGTQAKRLEKEFGVVYVGMGDVLREMAKEQSPIGRRIDEIVNQKGQLISDELATEIIELQLGSIPPGTGFVLDGYPRTVVQAGQFKDMLEGLGRLTPQPVFLNLLVPREESKRRLKKRREIEGRHDDTAPLIEKRLAIYDKQTKPLLDSVKPWARVVDIDGNQPIPAVTDSILKELKRATA